MSKEPSNAVVRLALLRPITILMLFASILVLGGISFLNIPLELIPAGVSEPFLSVQAQYNNATARDVEDKITRPLEEAVATMPDVVRVFSTSSANRGRVNLLFERNVNIDRAYRELRDRIQRVKPDLPEDLETVQIQKRSSDGIPIAFYGLSWDLSVQNPYDKVNRYLLPQLQRIEGVGLVASEGADKKEIRIEIDRERAEAANLDILSLAQRLGNSHFTLASGDLQEVDGNYLLRSMAEYQNAQDLEEVVVGAHGLRLKDVARVVYDYPEKESYFRFRGRPLLVLFIFKESEANTSQVAKAVEQALDAASKDPVLAGIEYETYFSQAKQIESSLEQVVDSGLSGGVLAFVVLGFFLRRMRLTLIISLSIPLSMFMALPVMYFSGQTINMVSLLGLMICIGLVVDNAVVIAENIDRHRNAGKGPYLAALHGASEVALPITLATATTMVVFLPTAILSAGITQVFMVQMVTPICVSLFASLFIALLLIPMASVQLLREEFRERLQSVAFGPAMLRADAQVKGFLQWAYQRSIEPLANIYVRFLRVSLRRRFDVALLALLALGSLAIPFSGGDDSVQMVLGEDSGGRDARIYYTLPSQVSLEEADRFFRGLEGWFEQKRESYGIDGELVEVKREFSRVTVFFKPPQPGDPPLAQTAKKLYEEMPCPPGWSKRSRAGRSDGSRDSTFRVYVYGDDHDEVQAVKDDLQSALVKVPGVLSVVAKERDTSRRNEMSLQVDPVWSERLGIAPRSVAATVAYALRGSPLPKFNGPQGEIDVWIRYEKQDREQIGDVLRFRVPTKSGSSVPLSALTEQKITRGDAVLTRNDRRVTGVVELELSPDERRKTIKTIRAQLKRYRLPEGMSFDAHANAAEMDAQQKTMLVGMALGGVLIFLIMGFLFESFVLPLSVLPAIPLSFVGVGWTLYVTGSHIDPLVVIALMLLMGLVVNNAIVLIDFVNAARKQGLSRDQAIIEAGSHRFRPILMTSLTTIGGMVPLAIAEAPAEGIPYGGFAKALVGGLVSSTILTLFIVPWAYTLLDDLRERVAAWFSRVVGHYVKPKD